MTAMLCQHLGRTWRRHRDRARPAPAPAPAPAAATATTAAPSTGRGPHATASRPPQVDDAAAPPGVSLRRLVTLIYPGLIVGVAVLVGALSYATGSQTVDGLSQKLLLETVARIAQAVDRHVGGSGPALEAAFPTGLPAPARIDGQLEALRRRFWIATSLQTDPNNFVYYGNRAGQFFGLWRNSVTEGELRIKLRADERRQLFTFSGIDGTVVPTHLERALFDPLERPWFKAAEVSTTDTWTATYVDFRSGELVTTRARRVPSIGGQSDGVVATDLSLRALNLFMRRLKVSEHALAFIVEPDGALIASSRSPNVVMQRDGRLARVNAVDSRYPLLLASYAQLQREIVHAGPSDAPGTFSFVDPEGGIVQCAFQRMRDSAGLDWITVVAVPRSDFMHGVTTDILRTALIGAAAALAAALAGFAILRSVAIDLRRLADAARAVGEGRMDEPLEVARGGEIGELAHTFRLMRQRLRVDSLTGLGNREEIVRSIAQRLTRRRRGDDTGRFAVLFLDLNNFKAVNDSFGHEVGDKVLVETGRRLRACTRATDRVARYAGDEFVVLLDDPGSDSDAEAIRRHVEAALAEPLPAEVLGGADTALLEGAAVGLAIHPLHGRTVDDLLAHADADMYGRKSRRRLPD